MKVLIGCEESQAVCKAFRELGHEAYSCDIQECSGGHPEWHMRCDVMDAIFSSRWDLVIAFPPCTDLAVSGARWFPEKRANGTQQKSIDFFMQIANAPKYNAPKLAIENPIGIMSTIYRKPDQIIQPWMFGHKETKATCLWLNGLPPLKETSNVKVWMDLEPDHVKHRIHRMPPGENRAKERSKTYTGIALAMAEQWGGKK